MDMHSSSRHAIESPYAWARLGVSLLLMTIGGCGMYSVAVVLPRLAAEFNAARADVSLPYTLTMIGFGFGGILMGRLSDRFGVMVPVLVGTVGLGAGFIAAGWATSLWLFIAAQGALIGFFGSSATFVPLVADTSQWFTRRRGIAVAICMSGNYAAGTVWPPILQHFIDTAGWRATYIGVGVFCLPPDRLQPFLKHATARRGRGRTGIPGGAPRVGDGVIESGDRTVFARVRPLKHDPGRMHRHRRDDRPRVARQVRHGH